jgi:hypothetical protein
LLGPAKSTILACRRNDGAPCAARDECIDVLPLRFFLERLNAGDVLG